MSKALYRKYRSKKLSEIVGQEHITTTLENAIKNHRLSHAYLFTGPRGVGKTSIARILAHEINQIPYEDESIHLDIIEIDAASNRRIDEIRDLRDKVHIAPTSSKYKVYIIDEVHMLTREAFNALLKTLEEPPKHVIFILATTELHKLPETIISRTQRFTFRPIATDQAVKHLASIAKSEGIKIDKEALRILAVHGNGSFRDSISLLDQVSSTSGKITASEVEKLVGVAPDDFINSLLNSIRTGRPSDIVELLDKAVEYGISSSKIAKQLAQTIRQNILEGKGSDKDITLLENLLQVSASPEPSAKLEIVILRANLNNSNTTQPATPEPQLTQATNTDQATSNKPASTVGTTAPNDVPRLDEKAPSKPKAESNSKATDTAIKESSPEKPSQSTAETIDESNKQSEPNETDTDLAETLASLSEWWDDVLKIIKSSNNTVYSVLRLAKTKVDNNVLKLMFKFPLHSKKIADSANHSKLQEAIKTVTGHSIEVVSMLEKDDEDSQDDTQVDTEGSTTENSSATSTDKSSGNDATDASITNISNIFGGGEVLES